MYPNDSYIKPTPIVSSTHNFLLCMLPVPKRSCNTELMCMSEFKKCSIQVMFCTLLPLDSSYNGMVIESIWINSWEGNSQSCKISQPSPLNQILYFLIGLFNFPRWHYGWTVIWPNSPYVTTIRTDNIHSFAIAIAIANLQGFIHNFLQLLLVLIKQINK